MHTTLTDYQQKVLMNCFVGKVITQITGMGNVLEDEYYFYPVKGEKYSLPRSKYGHHTINRKSFHRLLNEGLIQACGRGEFEISRKGQEQIMGHDQFTAYKYQDGKQVEVRGKTQAQQAGTPEPKQDGEPETATPGLIRSDELGEEIAGTCTLCGAEVAWDEALYASECGNCGNPITV